MFFRITRGRTVEKLIVIGPLQEERKTNAEHSYIKPEVFISITFTCPEAL